MKAQYLFFFIALAAVNVNADSSTLDAVIGGGIGGATGAAIGNEIGGRDGAIIGGAVGGAVGVAVNTEDGPDHYSPSLEPNPEQEYQYRRNHRAHPHNYHCPPGQRKKGRC